MTWGGYDDERVVALELPFEVVHAGTDAALFAELESAYQRQAPIMLWVYTPHWAPAKYDGEWVEFPKYTAECYTDPSLGACNSEDAKYDCGKPRGPIWKVAWAGLKDKWPGAHAAIQAFTVDNDAMGQMITEVDLEGKTVEDVSRAGWPRMRASGPAGSNSVEALSRSSSAERRVVPVRLTWCLALCLFLVLWLAGRPVAAWAFKVPKAWRIPLQRWIGDAMDWLVQDAGFGLFSFTDLTRFIAAVIDVPYRIALSLLSTAGSKARARPLCSSCRPCPGLRSSVWSCCLAVMSGAGVSRSSRAAAFSLSCCSGSGTMRW